jgi:hypothetical protein
MGCRIAVNVVHRRPMGRMVTVTVSEDIACEEGTIAQVPAAAGLRVGAVLRSDTVFPVTRAIRTQVPRESLVLLAWPG